MPRAKQRTPALRDRVVQVAIERLDREGIEGFTTRGIAEGASTSTPAVYELFGDKSGLVREVFFEGFRRLRDRLERVRATDDPCRDLVRTVQAYRSFVRANPVLAAVMFGRPFAAFDPGPEDVAAGRAVRELIVGRVRRCIDAGLLAGNATDIAHVLLALAQGLAAQESAGWLGTSKASVDRRWGLALGAALAGFAPA